PVVEVEVQVHESGRGERDDKRREASEPAIVRREGDPLVTVVDLGPRKDALGGPDLDDRGTVVRVNRVRALGHERIRYRHVDGDRAGSDDEDVVEELARVRRGDLEVCGAK